MEISMQEAIALVVGFISLFLLVKKYFVPSKRFPPGPIPLPILGNMLLISKHESIADLANELIRSYGPVVTLWIGSTPAIIISGPEMLHDAMITHGSVYLGRQHTQSCAIINNNDRGLTTGVGDRHKFFRKLVVTDIFTNSRVTGFRPIRDQEVEILVETLKAQASQNGGVVTDFRSAIRLTISNLLLGICFGRRLNMEEFLEMDEVMVQRFSMLMGKPRDFISLLRLFPDKRGEQLQLSLRKKTEEFFRPLIQERKQLLLSGNAPEKGTFVDTLLRLQSGQQKVEITDADVVTLCMDVLNAGTDTSSLNMEYIIANLINRPEIQERLYEEISAVLGTEKKNVEEEDIPRLPYLQAVVKETLRRHPPGRLAPARVPLSPTKLAGYDIPPNALVLQHLESVAMNPEIWADPLEFRPERFLGKSVDITGSTGITLVPFGVGRRICPAINIALLHAHCILARLVQTFEWKSATPGQRLDLTAEGGISNPMKYPLTAILRER